MEAASTGLGREKDADMAHFLLTSYRKKQAPETAIQGEQQLKCGIDYLQLNLCLRGEEQWERQLQEISQSGTRVQKEDGDTSLCRMIAPV